MFKKLLVIIPLLFALGCEDNISHDIDANMNGKIQFSNLKIDTDSEESPYHNYGGR
ncbi:hypothetical protein HN615_12705 [Candidatus Woesearchaeota archaeon]|nr:hypothetical protein [Candidatus Woesearchaeota archaeon]